MRKSRRCVGRDGCARAHCRVWARGFLILAGVGCLVSPGRAQDPPEPIPVSLKTYDLELSQLKLPPDSTSKILKALNLEFPMELKRKGCEVELDNPTIRQVTDPVPALILGADIRYRKTRGFPQFSTRGYIELMSPITACFTISEGDDPVVVKAEIRLTKITVRKLRLKSVPRWLTESNMVIDQLERKIGGERRIDFTPVVQKLLQSGGEMAALDR